MSRHPVLRAEELLEVGVDDLLAFWDDLPYLCQQELICHPKAPPRLVWHTIKSQPDWVYRAAICGYIIRPEIAWDVFFLQALQFDYFYPELVRRHPMPPDLLLVLSERGDLNARYEVARHIDATDEVLERLSRDVHRDIRRAARRTLSARRAARRSDQGEGIPK